MKKTFLKAVAATTVIAATMALFSTTVFADDVSFTPSLKNSEAWECNGKSGFDGSTKSAINTTTVGGHTLSYVIGSSSDVPSDKGFKMGGNGNANPTSTTQRCFSIKLPAGATLEVSAQAQSSGNESTMYYKLGSAEVADFSPTATTTSTETKFTVNNSGESDEILAFSFNKKEYITAIELKNVTAVYDPTVTVSPSSALLSISKADDSVALNAVVEHADGSPTISWSTESKDITLSAQTGADVTVKAADGAQKGTATVTAKINVGGKEYTDDCEITLDDFVVNATSSGGKYTLTNAPAASGTATYTVKINMTPVPSSSTAIMLRNEDDQQIAAMRLKSTDGTVALRTNANSDSSQTLSKAVKNGEDTTVTFVIDYDSQTVEMSIDGVDGSISDSIVSKNLTDYKVTQVAFNGKDASHIFLVREITATGETETSTIASTVKQMGNYDYYALDMTGKYVYIIHPVKKTDDGYSTADKLVLYPSGAQSSSDKLLETSEIYETIQFAEGDTISISDLSSDEDYADIVGLYAVKQAAETPSKPQGTNYNYKLEPAA